MLSLDKVFNAQTVLKNIIRETKLLKSGRSSSLLIELIDKPGQLKEISRIIADCGGNVTGVHYEKGNTESVNPLNPETGALEGENITQQTHRVCQNLKAVLEAAGGSLQSAVKTVCFLANMADFAAFNEVYAQYFTEKPARSCVAVKDLPKGALVEVEVVAEKE